MSILYRITLNQAVWLFPAATAIHFLEESTGFAAWARRNLSTRYSDGHWRRVHAAGLPAAICAAAIVADRTSPISVFLFIALFLAPMVCNTLFHLASSAFFRSYSPGTISAMLLFPALGWHLVSRFSEAGLIRAPAAATAALAGAALHAADLAATTFFVRWSVNRFRE